MCLSSKTAVIFSYGVGGHSAQAERLARILKPGLSGFQIISISDNCRCPDWSDSHYITGEIRKKIATSKFLRTLVLLRFY